ncbi:MAG TPA: UDP-N-acetylmuramoyl-L-alanine--D-glutamate ligase, partial [Lachnospiraceae bacterium]|nr:UDP-N-acetylmuramoyl-L-alanine--D-glutamate ligase [Lachnospiraceae bacterium]
MGASMNLSNKEVLVVGTGISGIAATNLLNGVNANVTLYDTNEALSIDEVMKRFQAGMRAKIIIGELPEEIIGSLDLVILSPGVPTDLPFVEKLRKTGVTIWGEIELAYQFEKGRIVAITGTNGKTTTTALVGEIMKTYFESTFVVGNIGIPYTEMVTETNEDSVTVAEVSSFQLETIQDFKPSVSAILNITPDHLNRHHTMEKYIEAKLNIASNQGSTETVVLNYDDEILREFGRKVNTNVIYFSSTKKLDRGIYLDGEDIIVNLNGNPEKVCNIHALKIIGKHSYENTMAA